MAFQDQDTAEFKKAEDTAAAFFSWDLARVRARFGAATDAGKVRPNNQDHYAVIRRSRSREVLLTSLNQADFILSDDEAYAMAVADGMGGAAFGELASRLALKIAEDLVGRSASWVMKLQDLDAQQIRQRAAAYAKLIHQALIECAKADARLAGMGTTITSVYTMGRYALVMHVGDSRAYIFREGWLEQITRDHTLAQALIDSGVAPEETTRMRHVLINCLGGSLEEPIPEINQLELADGDILLLCTDGLTNLVSDREIADILARHSDPQEACDSLVTLALERGGTDNVTVVVGQFAIEQDKARSGNP